MPYIKVPLKSQPVDRRGHPMCANLGCGLPLEEPIKWVELHGPQVKSIKRCFCVDCYAALMEEGHAQFYKD